MNPGKFHLCQPASQPASPRLFMTKNKRTGRRPLSVFDRVTACSFPRLSKQTTDTGKIAQISGTEADQRPRRQDSRPSSRPRATPFPRFPRHITNQIESHHITSHLVSQLSHMGSGESAGTFCLATAVWFNPKGKEMFRYKLRLRKAEMDG